jgi:hypothetical protein
MADETLEVDPKTGINAVCGRLTLPAIVDGHFVDIVVDVPPPEGWTSEQVDSMWRSAAALEAARVLDTTLQLVGRAREELVAGLDWQALAPALDQADALSIRWPVIRRQRRVIAPTASPRGREDEPATVQALEGGRLHAAGPPLRIEQAVYRETRAEPWRSASLAADLARLIRRVEEMTDDEAAHRAVRPLRTVRALAAPPLLVGAPRELPLSSWPPPAARLAWIVRRAVAQIGKVGAAAELHAPVRRLWQLYEDWVAVEILKRLTDVLGEPTRASGRLLGTWACRHAHVELWSQPLFTYSSPRKLCGQEWVSVGYGALQPDLVLAVRVGTTARLAFSMRRRTVASTSQAHSTSSSRSTCGDSAQSRREDRAYTPSTMDAWPAQRSSPLRARSRRTPRGSSTGWGCFRPHRRPTAKESAGRPS